MIHDDLTQKNDGGTVAAAHSTVPLVLFSTDLTHNREAVAVSFPSKHPSRFSSDLTHRRAVAASFPSKRCSPFFLQKDL